ncbi:unnamed protein product [Kuraishia capsulata CBS 1993]|uniref:Major facilitator superfamily (MFS) profile domain-containing protein n=1 Tax=Kuraishia capsulata CBS 1993 TaxID=1382522 RepID=W6MGN3_9ASCO|nr:uncharacterized protein KUCA_T00001283001 [Kuraishia capsulata CBS 1993]CDK25314.1 unnamed protein product [Kuraishia capsulata CBS 1993]
MTVGRIINAIGVGVAYSIVPIYLAECSPPTVRGTLTSFYQWFFTFGQFWAYFIIYFTKDKTTKWSYLTAILVQVVIPAFMLAATPFLIESPRWLIITGKREQGVISMSKLYGKDTQYDINKIADEIEEAHNALQNYRKDTSYLDLFKGVNLRRTLIAMAIPCLLTGQGLVFMGAYLVLFLESIGVDDANLMLMVIMLVLLATNTFSFWGADRFGRRNLLMISSFFMAISFYLVAVFAWYVRSNAANNTVVAFLFIWCIVYGATWAPLAHITVGEIPSTQLREKTLAVAMFLNFGISMLVSFVNPYIQNAGEGNLQGRVGFVYGSVSWLAIIMVYFGLPEVKGLSLDVIDTLFELKTSAKTFLKEGQKLMAADGVVELDHVLSAHKSIVEGERVLESMFSPKEKMYEE